MSTIAGPSDYILEVVNLFHTGHVEPQTWLKQLTGTTRTGVILKDVSFEVHSGEIMAILGSKGSGKKALLDTIACRVQGPRKGYVLLNGVTVNRRLFTSAGSYLSGAADEYLPQGLTTHQILHYEACLTLKIPASLRRVRVRQILADVALTQAVSTNIDSLTMSERRRLAIGLQLVKDPVVLLADEPAWNLDPLNTYFIISILSNYAKKYGRIVLLTMEKPRSDIFPFLDRVTYLCLGDVVYSGNTRLMLDYFRMIGFSCPEVENPLMYYLCLATVDRRSHDRFVESSNQVGLLVEKFKMEGSSFRKSNTFNPADGRPGSSTPLHALGKPSSLSNMGTLILRNYATTFMFTWCSIVNIFFHLVFLPFLMFILWIFYFGAKPNYQHTYFTLNGLILNTLAITYFGAIWSTIYTFEPHRNRYYQESRDGSYTGPTFLFSYTLASIPYSVVTCLIASRIVYECTPLQQTSDWLLLLCVMFSCYLAAQQQTYTLMLFFKNSILSTLISQGFYALTICLSSGTLRTMRSLENWLYYVTYVTQPRYAGAFLNEQIYTQFNDPMIGSARIYNGKICSIELDWNDGCRYINGTHYLEERYYHLSSHDSKDDLNYYLNFGLCFVFPIFYIIFNLFILMIPFPGLVKQKFRE